VLKSSLSLHVCMTTTTTLVHNKLKSEPLPTKIVEEIRDVKRFFCFLSPFANFGTRFWFHITHAVYNIKVPPLFKKISSISLELFSEFC
jgi:hypothetical protein